MLPKSEDIAFALELLLSKVEKESRETLFQTFTAHCLEEIDSVRLSCCRFSEAANYASAPLDRHISIVYSRSYC